MLEGLQEGLLNRVLGIFAIVCDVFRYSEEFAVVSSHEFLESRHISVLSGMHEIEIIPCHCLLCELCRACHHVRSTPLDNTIFVTLSSPETVCRFRCNADWKYCGLTALRPSRSS